MCKKIKDKVAKYLKQIVLETTTKEEKEIVDKEDLTEIQIRKELVSLQKSIDLLKDEIHNTRIRQEFKEVNGKIKEKIDKGAFSELLITQLFAQSLARKGMSSRQNVSCPDHIGFKFDDTSASNKGSGKPSDNGNNCDFSKYRNRCGFGVWLIPVLVILLLAAMFLLPIKCCGANSDSLVTLNSNRTNIPLRISTRENCNQLIYAHRIVIDSTCSVAQDSVTSSPAKAQKTIHGEIAYRNTSWQVLLYCGVLAILLLTALIVTLRGIITFLEKKTEWEQKHLELHYKDTVRLSDEDREYERLQYKTELSIYEKREKAKIDEWIRDNEHARKLDMMEQERIAELNKLLLEMAKVKNTVTLSDPKGSGKTIVIERSVLSEECCNELKDIAGKHFSQEDECCKLLKEMFHCLMDGTSSQDRCKRIKELLQCLLCHDSDCDKKYKDLCNKIDQVILILSNNNIAFNPNGMPVVNNINFTKGK